MSEIVDGVYTGRPGGPFTYREGKAEAIRDEMLAHFREREAPKFFAGLEACAESGRAQRELFPAETARLLEGAEELMGGRVRLLGYGAFEFGDFILDRDQRTEMAVQSEDGSVHVLKRGDLVVTSGTGGLYPPLVPIARVVKAINPVKAAASPKKERNSSS